MKPNLIIIKFKMINYHATISTFDCMPDDVLSMDACRDDTMIRFQNDFKVIIVSCV